MKPTKMSAFGQSIAAAVAVAMLSPSSRLAAQDATATPASVVEGVFTTDQAERGRRQFRIACESCHSAAEHTGRNFESKWTGSTVGDVFDLIATTMPESDPGSLKPDEYASIIAFFLSESGYKEGTRELSSDLELLKRIRIDVPTR